jgi:hypothetical protein
MKNETAGRKILAEPGRGAPTRAGFGPRRKVWKGTTQETSVAFVKKLSRSIQLEKPVSELFDDYCKFVDCAPDNVADFGLQKTLARD